MGKKLLVKERLDAGERIVRDFGDYIPISAAFWVNPEESDDWYLYIASPEIDGGNLRERYLELIARKKNFNYPWLDTMHIKLVNSNSPLAKQAMELQDIYPPDVPLFDRINSVLEVQIDSSYIYPKVITTQPTP